jgi:O-antigen/teichoic acid export membrane protein
MKNSITPSRKKATIIQAVGGYINTSILVVQGLLLIPLYLHYIDIKTYGFWLATGGILSMLGVMNLSLGNMLIQRIAKAYGKQDNKQIGAYFINGMLIYFFICLLLVVIGWSISIWIPNILKINGNQALLIQQCFLLAVIALTVGLFNECLRGFSQGMLRPGIPIVGMIFGRIGGLVATVFLLTQGFGLWSIPLGILINELIILTVNFFNAVNLFRSLFIKISFDIKIIKEYLKISPLLTLTTVGNAITNSSQPLLIAMFLGPQITAIYMINRKAADIIFSLLNVFVGSTMGSFSHLVSNQNKKISAVMKSLVILCFSIGAIGYSAYVGVNEAFISLWVGETFSLDKSIILFIALASFSRVFGGLFRTMLFGLGDFVVPSILVFFESIVSILLVISLIDFVGVAAVPIVYTLSMLLVVIILGLRLKKECMVTFNAKSTVKLFFSGALVFFIGMVIASSNLGLNTWFEFAVYLSLFSLIISIIIIIINLKDFVDIYKKHFR